LLDAQQSAVVSKYSLATSSQTTSDEQAMLKLNIGYSYVDSIGYYHLAGEVTNQADKTANYVKVAGAFFDKSGKIVATSFAYTQPEQLSADQTAPFELVILDNKVGSQIASYSVNVQSEQYAMIDPSLPAAQSTINPAIQTAPTNSQPTTTPEFPVEYIY